MWRKLRNFCQHFVRFSEFKTQTSEELELLRSRVYKLEQDALLREGSIKQIIRENQSLRLQYSELLHYVGDYRNLAQKYEHRFKNQG